MQDITPDGWKFLLKLLLGAVGVILFVIAVILIAAGALAGWLFS